MEPSWGFGNALKPQVLMHAHGSLASAGVPEGLAKRLALLKNLVGLKLLWVGDCYSARTINQCWNPTVWVDGKKTLDCNGHTTQSPPGPSHRMKTHFFKRSMNTGASRLAWVA